MREIPIFIASSVREFKEGRLELSPFLEMLNKVYKRMDAQIVWNRPETSSRVMNFGGSQLVFDDFIRDSEFFALIVGKSVGAYTRHEYEIALERFAKTGKPKILPCFLADTSPEAQAFRAELQNAPIGVQFIDPYDNFDAVKNQLQFEIANYVVETAPQSDAETDMNRARERIKDKIRGLRAEIWILEVLPTSQETIAEITLNYAEIWRLVREYKVEPDMLLDYMEFLWKQHQYGEAIDAGKWLEGFYEMEPPGNYKLSLLKNHLGLCYMESNQHGQAERYYREELEINRRLAERDSAYLPYVAATCGNLGILYATINQLEKAKEYFKETLEIYRRLADANPAYLPDVAQTCGNLGNLLSKTNQPEEAEARYGEALETYRRLADANPDAYLPYVAGTCNNLACLLDDTNRKEEAEARYGEALETYRRLADANPDAYLPDVAATCYNLGLFERERDNLDAARRYFEEALSLNEKFPHRAKNAQKCRDALALLDLLAALQDA